MTLLLRRWASGEREALDGVVAIVEPELRLLARRQLRRQKGGRNLDSASLVNEAWCRLAGGAAPDCKDRIHFLGIAGRVMRRILVDRARKRARLKRGGGTDVSLTSLAGDRNGLPLDEILALHEALDRLEAMSQREARVVEMWAFGGLTQAEIAEALDVSERTVARDLRLGRAWLYRELHAGR